MRSKSPLSISTFIFLFILIISSSAFAQSWQKEEKAEDAAATAGQNQQAVVSPVCVFTGVKFSDNSMAFTSSQSIANGAVSDNSASPDSAQNYAAAPSAGSSELTTSTSPQGACIDQLYVCDGASGGSANVKTGSDCSKCASNHCDGCCAYFYSTAAAKTRCCANECGTVC